MPKKDISFLSGKIVITGKNPRWKGVFLGPEFCFKGEYSFFNLINCKYIHSNGNITKSVCEEPPVPEDKSNYHQFIKNSIK